MINSSLIVRNQFHILRQFLRDYRKGSGFRNKNNVGIKKRLAIFSEENPDLEMTRIDERVLDEMETELDNSKALSDFYRRNVNKMKMKTEFKTVERKYFDKIKQPNFLTWSEKEQIKELHKSEPKLWTCDKLSQSFPATPDIIRKIIDNNWKAENRERILKHDKQVSKHWEMLRKGQLNLEPALEKHLSAFSSREHVQHSEEYGVVSKIPSPPRQSEFTNIISSNENDNLKSKDTSPNVHYNGNQSTNAHYNGNQSTNAHYNGNQSINAHYSGNQSTNAYINGNQSTNAYYNVNQSKNAHINGNQSKNAHINGNQSTNAHYNRNQSTNAHYNGNQSTNAHYNGNQSANAHFNEDQSTNAHYNKNQSTNTHYYEDQSTKTEITSLQPINSTISKKLTKEIITLDELRYKMKEITTNSSRLISKSDEAFLKGSDQKMLNTITDIDDIENISIKQLKTNSNLVKIKETKLNNDLEEIIPMKISLPEDLPKASVYRVKDVYYDTDGEFLYRVPGMKGS